MKKFELRRDRFELFENFENPLLNITFKLEVPDFRGFSKSKNLPPFHFFLYALFESLMEVEEFRYRIVGGEVKIVDRLIPSYTVMNVNNDLNFTRFEYSSDIRTFVERSLRARDESVASVGLLHTALELSEVELKQYVFITSIPWLDFTSIQHPVRKFKSADIPSIAWGKMSEVPDGKLSMPFSVQAHHGFVDGHHIHLLSQKISEKILFLMKTI